MENHFKKYVEVHISHGVNSIGRTRVLKCHDTFLLELHTRFSSTSLEPMTFELFMKSGAIEASWSTATHVEAWSELPTQDGEATVIEAAEPQFLGFRFEDENGIDLEQSEIQIDQKVTLIIETENGDGELIDLSLNDDRLDFKYKDKVLENDILKGISITGTETSISLIAIEQID